MHDLEVEHVGEQEDILYTFELLSYQSGWLKPGIEARSLWDTAGRPTRE